MYSKLRPSVLIQKDHIMAHPSVRIKGTEHSYNPVLCQDDKCQASSKGSHMHCPFCSVTEAYQDPVILRAHYRVKHVDKGIDFAGLKVLRCCNHCEIVGTIKGEKKFKGAHWHCYRCRNGFNRRDEAVKHYKTHFRNPHTTFQIQITQEVNSRQYYEQSAEAHAKAYGGLTITAGTNGDYSSIGSVFAQTVISSAAGTETFLTDVSKDSSVNNGITVGAEETVGPAAHSSRRQTLILMDSDDPGNTAYEDTGSLVTETVGEAVEQNLLLEKQLIELHQQNQSLRLEKEETEKRLRAEIQQLKDHMAGLVQANVKMFEELQLYRAADDTEHKIAKLLETMERQHSDLLHTQLACLRKEVLRSSMPLTVNGDTETLRLTLPHHNENHGGHVISLLESPHCTGREAETGGLAALEIVEVQLEPAADLHKASGTSEPPYHVEDVQPQRTLLTEKRKAAERAEVGCKAKIQKVIGS
ncbi:uncharacterized protein zgc:193801 isoform X1 [Polypterus senegalus]|uniref:uncharacterized protein zgc:193801 isoform X1 n=1 Tax=Polypterus senegalus TaxID=55291 RepID=UPI001963CB52|nr:uncharacterized protein zgc:193801 isoform X1 [Polypterus senegalus]XP_039628221.1 uncharacterized protein zgc:193801 isoform X1 [Polypterus senegalus]